MQWKNEYEATIGWVIDAPRKYSLTILLYYEKRGFDFKHIVRFWKRKWWSLWSNQKINRQTVNDRQGVSSFAYKIQDVYVRYASDLISIDTCEDR